jgi:hypothetical protein
MVIVVRSDDSINENILIVTRRLSVYKQHAAKKNRLYGISVIVTISW